MSSRFFIMTYVVVYIILWDHDVAQSSSFHVKLIRLSEFLSILRYEISPKPPHWQINTLDSIEWVYRKIRHVYALNSVNEGCVMYSILHMRYEIILLNNTTSIYMITSHRTVINNISLPLTRITSLLLDRFTRLVTTVNCVLSTTFLLCFFSRVSLLRATILSERRRCSWSAYLAKMQVFRVDSPSAIAEYNLQWLYSLAFISLLYKK